MKLYPESNIDLEIQKENILIKLNNNLNIQRGNQKILMQCLFNLNSIIQNISQLEILTTLSVILKNLKDNLDFTKTNLSTLESLKHILTTIDFSDSKSLEAVENYNTLVSNFDILLYESMCNINAFIFEYMKHIESFTRNSVYNYTDKQINLKGTQENELKTEELKDNKILLISETQNKVFLPYSISDLKNKLKNSTLYNSIEEIINNEYILSLDKYKNSIIARFKETFNLMRKKENASISDSLDLALELSFNNLLNPAIITACKNLDELDVYLDCLNSNELDKFTCFEIKYEILPRKIKE